MAGRGSAGGAAAAAAVAGAGALPAGPAAPEALPELTTRRGGVEGPQLSEPMELDGSAGGYAVGVDGWLAPPPPPPLPLPCCFSTCASPSAARACIGWPRLPELPALLPAPKYSGTAAGMGGASAACSWFTRSLRRSPWAFITSVMSRSGSPVSRRGASMAPSVRSVLSGLRTSETRPCTCRRRTALPARSNAARRSMAAASASTAPVCLMRDSSAGPNMDTAGG